MRLRIIIFLVCSYLVIQAQQNKEPIIDIHLHAYDFINPGIPASWAGEEYARVLESPSNADEHLRLVLEQMRQNHIVLGLTSSNTLKALMKWQHDAPGLFMGGIQTEGGEPVISTDSLRILYEEGIVQVLGELGFQYYGKEPDTPEWEPYYALAEELGIPVCLHTGLGPPGGPHSFAPDFRTTLGKPSLFEEVLVRHPDLKAFLAHAGWPYITETIALMYIYPNLYTDIGVLTWALPRNAFYAALKQLMDAGFGKRIMFGSDQMLWPEAIGIAVQTLNEAPFLTEEEKRDILYDNAARFLELSEETINDHHQR